ncbi:MAG: PQQ-like beta-propeller repeat protein [Planctomycetaceae bacterium]|nr:PQQ-like beta-propeller repeat protein [Planctomycetaceae bacterium]
MSIRNLIIPFLCTSLAATTSASDWSRFRGPNGSGVSPDASPTPTQWAEDSDNVKWKAAIPGPGLSSPIVIGDKVVVTCWSGYATSSSPDGSIDDLKRNVVCLERSTGQTLWSATIDSVLPETEYRGMFAENGYASHTPATDGERVFVFFGKTGVLAFDLSDGKQLWQTSVGTNDERRGWGTASSPIYHDGLVIVPAFIESDSLVALNANSGEVVWEQKAPGYTSNWSTPILVDGPDRTELVIAVPGEVWGINPKSGKLYWYCEVPGSDSARASVVAADGMILAMAGGRGASTSVAIAPGGKGAVEPEWTGRDVSSIASPIVHNGRMYVINNKVVTSVDLKTGRRISQTRMKSTASSPAAESENSGRGGRGGYGGGRGGQDYSSPVIAGNHLYYASRNGEVFVFELAEEITQVGSNAFASDRTDFSATPAIADGAIFLRSSKAVYCIAD